MNQRSATLKNHQRKETLRMSQTVKHILRLFWFWRETNELAWLNQMSLRGWHLSRVHFLIYTFKKGEPQDLIYHWDMIPQSKEDQSDMIETFKAAGWHHLFTFGSIIYFQTPRSNPYNQAYTNHQSQSIKYQTLLLIHVILFPMIMFPLLMLSKALAANPSPFLLISTLINLIMMSVLIYSTFKLIRYVSKFNQSIKE
jgi:hypothetical protein